MWGIIGGTGFEKFEAFETLNPLSTSTPYGEASSGFKRVRIHGKEALFIPRHGLNHEHLPSEVNYRANIYALKEQGCTKLISLSAIGSLRSEIRPGDLVCPFSYINQTKMRIGHTFAGNGIVGHVSLANPVWDQAIEWISNHKIDFDFSIHTGKCYVVIEGPAFSTKAESHLYRQLKADVIGMTGFLEYALAREAGICYLPCCFVADYDCWDNSVADVTLDAVIRMMHLNHQKAFILVDQLLRSNLEEDPKLRQGHLKNALITSFETLSKEKQAIFEILAK